MNGKKFKFYRLFVILFCVLMVRNVMADQSKYYFKLQGEGVFVRLYVNDAEVLSNLKFGEMNFYQLASQYFKSGKNEVVIDMEPYNHSERNYTFNEDDFYLSLDVSNENGASEEVVNLVKLKFDGDKLYQLNKKKDRKEFQVSESNTFVLLDDVFISDFQMRYENRVSSASTKRVRVEFSINDNDLLDPNWIAAKKIDQLKPHDKKRLWDAYAHVYEVIKDDNEGEYKDLMRSVNTHLSHVIGYDVDDFANEFLNNDPLVEPDLNFSPNFKIGMEGDYFVRSSPNNKMFNIIPNPLVYTNDEGEVGLERVFYFCDFGNGFEICHVYSGY